MVEVFAPARVDLAGGTLDLWPLYCFHDASITVNAAIETGVRLRVTPGGAAPGGILFSAPGSAPARLGPADAGTHLAAAVGFHLVPGGGLACEVLEQPPVGSGLGASSAFAVALARACLAVVGRRLRPAALVALLRDLEARVLGTPTGTQDYWAALAGGVLGIHYRPGGEVLERLAVSRSWLGARLLVVYTGVSHHSGMVNWEVVRARVDGEARTAAALDAISAAARRCRAALLDADAAGVGRAVAAEWSARRTLAPEVSNPQLESILEAGRAAGALAGKACGAGGGGSVLFWVEPGGAEAVATAAVAAAPPGARVLPSGIAARGATARPTRRS